MKRDSIRAFAMALLMVIGASVNSAAALAKPSQAAGYTVVWDGETRDVGEGWTTNGGNPQTKVILSRETGIAHSGRSALCLRDLGSGWLGCGWSWVKPLDIRPMRHLRFWILVSGPAPVRDIELNLTSVHGPNTPHESTLSNKVMIKGFSPAFNDGKWHEVVIPLAAMAGGGIDPTQVNEINLGTYTPAAVDCRIYVDDIAFDAL